ncbi:MAG: histidinol-phosphatase HisJ family protein [Ruminococcaceae bacterium]|nr:histidinol-phosphatase HisJ family protein [Oscillospiraceae bacterium]
MILKDLHTHTTYCDGRDTPRDMAEAALELGMKTLGFSGHSYTFFDERYCMSKKGTELYKKEIAALKEEYKGRLNILLGIELDAYSEQSVEGFDYVIGSVHYVKVGGEYLPVDEAARFEGICRDYFGGDYLAFAEEYYRTVRTLAEKKIDIIGHIDVITKFNEGGKLFDESDPRYIEASRGAVDALLPLGIPFEVNTGAIARGYRTEPYPSASLREYILSKGGKLILSSDSHNTANLCFQFETWETKLGE